MMESYCIKGDSGLLSQLAMKISRLRRRLLSYGWTAADVSSIILNEFLKIEEVDWKIPSKTTNFYHTKDRFHVDSETTQMIMCLESIIPNL